MTLRVTFKLPNDVCTNHYLTLDFKDGTNEILIAKTLPRRVTKIYMRNEQTFLTGSDCL